MARDVEFNITADDKTGTALAEAEAKFKASQERARKESKKTGDEVGENLKKGVKKSESSIIDTVRNSLGFGGAAGTNVLVATIAAGAPLIGATLSAAVIGGAGVGGVIGGVLLAARDPRVQAAGKELGQNLLGQLTKDAEPFIQPVLKNIGKIEVAFTGMNGRIKNIFAASSNFLDPLVNGALDGVSGILKGVEDLTTKGKPVMDAFGRAFATVGQATGHALSTIAGDSKDAAAGLDQLSGAVGTTIEGLGYLVRGLTELYGKLRTPDEKFNNFLTRLITGTDQATAKMSVSSTVAGTLGSVMQTVATKVLSAGEAAGKAGLQMRTYTDLMGDAAQRGHSLYDSQTQVAQSLADARKALKDNGKTLDENTQKGRDNRRALSQVASGLVAIYSGYVNVNGEGAGAAKIAQRNRDSFVKLARQFGLTKDQASDLASQMGLIKSKKVDFYANTHDAEARLKALQDRINNVHGKSVNVSVYYKAYGTSAVRALNKDLDRNRQGRYSLAGMGWAANDLNSGMSRTGGPTPVNVTSEVAVNLDGRPFRAMTVAAVDASARRQAWRAKVGTR